MGIVQCELLWSLSFNNNGVFLLVLLRNGLNHKCTNVHNLCCVFILHFTYLKSRLFLLYIKVSLLASLSLGYNCPKFLRWVIYCWKLGLDHEEYIKNFMSSSSPSKGDLCGTDNHCSVTDLSWIYPSWDAFFGGNSWWFISLCCLLLMPMIFVLEKYYYVWSFGLLGTDSMTFLICNYCYFSSYVSVALYTTILFLL